mmetsp:Transcript_35689/g.93023  ORF Transcript_35689/g.93023 Transcript_35689/m.93023 type:complete len:328 (-) Transcript_35689:197-1180(-)
MPAERKRKQKVDDDEGGICICEVLDDSILKSVDTLRRSPRTRARLVQVLSILLGLWSCRVLWRKRVVSDPVLSSVLQVFLTLLAIDVALSFIVTLYLVAPKNVPFLKEKDMTREERQGKRIYHCKKCSSDTLLFDHHCFWLDGDVWAMNRLSYIHTTFKTFIIYLAGLAVIRNRYTFSYEGDGDSPIVALEEIGIVFLGGPVALFAGYLALRMVYCAVQGKTLLEARRSISIVRKRCSSSAQCLVHSHSSHFWSSLLEKYDIDRDGSAMEKYGKQHFLPFEYLLEDTVLGVLSPFFLRRFRIALWRAGKSAVGSTWAYCFKKQQKQE